MSIYIDFDDIVDDVTDRELVSEIKSRLGYYRDEQREKLMALLREKDIDCGKDAMPEENRLIAENLIDGFKIKAFKEAMEKYSLEEIENRLK